MTLRSATLTCRRLPLPWLAGLVVLVLVGSAGAQDATTIAEARETLEAARSTRAVRVLAAAELDAAERALERALAAQGAGRAPSEVLHLAYLAERRAEVARIRAQERQLARALRDLSATHALIAEARALEVAAAERRALELAQRLKRFDVRTDRGSLLLVPREAWFDDELMPARRALRAIAEAARLLGELQGREVAVLGHALRGAPYDAVQGRGPDTGPATGAPSAKLAAGYREDIVAKTVADPNDPGCARAEVVRAFLISNGVDPRRVVASCLPPQAAPDVSARAAGAPVGALPATTGADAPLPGTTAIMLLPAGFQARGEREQILTSQGGR